MNRGRVRPWLVLCSIVVFSVLQLFHSVRVIPSEYADVENRPLGGTHRHRSGVRGPYVPPYAVSSIKARSAFAYVFLVAGCDPEKPWNYRNYIYNILASRHVLQSHGSQADVVVMLQLSKYANSTRLKPRDESWLRNMNVQFFYLPKPVRDNFYAAQMEKFRILQLTQYDRVMYLDADVMPLCNLDYLFRVGTPNVVFAWFNEPSHGGIFVLETGSDKQDLYGEIRQIVQRREEEAMQMPYPHWDPFVGWGAPIPDDDPWRVIQTVNGSWTGLPGFPPVEAYDGRNWTFHGDFADQGLLYYWVKFHSQSVTIVNLEEMERWVPGNDGKAKLQKKETIAASEVQRSSCLPRGMDLPGRYGSSRHPMFVGHAPHRDFIHFTGDAKPWESPAPVPLPESRHDLSSSKAYWYWSLREVMRQLNATIRNFDRLPHSRRPALGRYPTYKAMKNTIETKQKRVAEGGTP